MAFPQDVLDLTVELDLDGSWTDITSKVQRRSDLIITRGRSDEGANVDRSRATMSLNNQDGRFSPRKPDGLYYGLIGRNTPLRVSKDPAPSAYLLLPASGGVVSTPDSANLSITGDLDIRADVTIPYLPPSGTALVFASKWEVSGSQGSWYFYLNSTGTISFVWTTNGTGGARVFTTSTVAAFSEAGRLAVRATLDVNNGAGGNTVTFYTATDIDSSWVQLGAAVVTAGVTSIFDSTAVVRLFTSQLLTDGVFGARLHAFQLYQNIAGTLRADVDLNDETATSSSGGTFTDGQGLVWTMSGDVSIVTPRTRFVGEVASWPQKWDPTGRDIYTEIEANGILRRLTQGASPLRSTLYRGILALGDTVRAYWPGEDDPGATSIASAVGGPPMLIKYSPSSSTSDAFDCSAPLRLLTGSEWAGIVPSYTGTGSIQLWFLLQVPAEGGSASAGQGICALYTTGTITQWNLTYEGGGGDLKLVGLNSSGTTVYDSGTFDFNIDGQLVRVSLDLDQNGGNVDIALTTLEVDGITSGGFTDSVAGTVTAATRVIMNRGGDIGDIVVGHISVKDTISDFEALQAELDAYKGETAGRRIERLCEEEGISFRALGDLDATSPMGVQTPQTLVDLLREAQDADGGILLEPRDLFGFGYRTRDSLLRQASLLELDYDADHLSGIEPVDDDQATRNDITLSRVGGSSVRAVKTTGPLSTQPPPDGVGTYDTADDVNVEGDSQLADLAGWQLHLGTVDEARYPVVDLDLARSPFVASSALALAAQGIDIGDRATIEDPPTFVTFDDISLMVQGLTETMSNKTHRISINCTPESPWGQAADYDASDARYTSDGSTLNEDLTTSETGVDIATSSGPLWSHTDGDFDIMIGGERMTVTAISGATSPQTFTVTRSVNGVVKAHSTGATMELAEPSVYVP